jgi:hypothetical protein
LVEARRCSTIFPTDALAFTRGGPGPCYRGGKVRMLIGGRSRLAVFLMRRLMFSAAFCYVACAGLAGCTDPLRGSTHGSGGAKSADAAMATGGLAGSGTVAASGGVSGTGGASVGGLRAGGASGSAGGASGGTSGTAPCAELAYDYCVEKCLAEYALSDNALCTNGAWSCRSGYVLASSCPVGACTVTPDACCDLTTGIVTKNSCATNGLRAPCSDGNVETYLSQAWCIPEALAGVTCSSLDRQPCAEPAVGCSDMSGGLVTCGCSSSGSDASAGTWHCSHYIGP